MTRTERTAENGLNLIEVVVALALLALVLLTISGLFVTGSQSVNTGKDLTEATSLATDILEEMDKWGFTQLWTNYGHAATDNAFSVDSLTNSYAQKWQSAISQRLPNAKATITVAPMNGSTFSACSGVRVKVVVDWTLKLRPRNVSLETVRF